MRPLPVAFALLLAMLGVAGPSLAGPLDCSGARVPPGGEHGAWAEVCPRTQEWEVGYVGGGQDFAVQDCEGEAFGVAVEINGADGLVCISVTIEPPSGVPELPASSFEAVNCTFGQGGLVIRVTSGVFAGTMAGLCVFYGFQFPHAFGDPTDPGLFVDLEGCSFGGSDPAVGAFGGGMAVCLVPILVIDPTLPPFDPEIGLSLDPCERGADPSIFIGDGKIVICIDAQVPL